MREICTPVGLPASATGLPFAVTRVLARPTFSRTMRARNVRAPARLPSKRRRPVPSSTHRNVSCRRGDPHRHGRPGAPAGAPRPAGRRRAAPAPGAPAGAPPRSAAAGAAVVSVVTAGTVTAGGAAFTTVRTFSWPPVRAATTAAASTGQRQHDQRHRPRPPAPSAAPRAPPAPPAIRPAPTPDRAAPPRPPAPAPAPPGRGPPGCPRPPRTRAAAARRSARGRPADRAARRGRCGRRPADRRRAGSCWRPS